MAIQYNDITAIGDVFEVHANTPIIGIQAISGYTDVILNETVDRYFNREFRYSVDGITYSDWTELTDLVLQDTFVPGTSIFDIQYRYTRAGTDSTGYLTFISIQLEGVIEEVQNPKVFTDLYFNKFFNYNDDSVLKWALNVLNKLYQRGVIANYVDRKQPGYTDEDYLALFGSLTHFMAILVRYAREFKDFTLNDILLTEYLRQKGVFVNDGMLLADLQSLLASVYHNFIERGTNEIIKQAGVDGRVVDGELLRLIRKGEFDEFIWGLLEPEITIWNINNNSPLYRGTKEAVNLIKAYEYEQDVQSLAVYPLTEESFVTLYTDVDKEVIRVLNSTSPNISGIGDALTNGKLILIDSRLSYEITFYVKQVVLSNSFSCQVYLYDENEDLLLDTPISAISGAQTNVVIDKEQLLQNDIYYFVRVILFNENIAVDASQIPDIGFGNHLIINNSEAKYMSIELGTEINDGNNDLRIWDFKVRPLMNTIANGFIMIPNIITSFIENNSEDINSVIEYQIKRYMIPYNTILKNQFLDELFVPEGTPLKIYSLTYTNETILGSENGTITIVAVGGTAPYQYSIDNGVTFQDTGIFTNLAPSSYDIVVEDANSVQVTDSVTILAGETDLTLNVFTTDASMIGISDGTIQALASGGTSPYFYSLDGVTYTVSNLFTGLAENTYTVYLRDTVGNIVTKEAIVGTVRDNLVTLTVTNATPTAISGATITITKIGTPSFSENYITNGSGQINVYLESGSYNFNIIAAGYTSSSILNQAITTDRNLSKILQSSLAISAVSTQASRTDYSDGVITISASGGFPGYEYSINGVDYVTFNNFTGLSVGSYTVYVKDSTGTVKSTILSVTAIRNRLVTVTIRDDNSNLLQNSTLALYREGILYEDDWTVEYYLTNSLGVATFYVEDNDPSSLGDPEIDIYSIRASLSGYITVQEYVYVNGIDVSVNYTLKRYRNIYFRISKDADPFIEGGVIIESIVYTTPFSTISVYTFATQEYVKVSNVVAGNYTVRISKVGFLTRNVSFTLGVDGNCTTVDSDIFITDIVAALPLPVGIDDGFENKITIVIYE